jgi:hypothetical protein
MGPEQRFDAGACRGALAAQDLGHPLAAIEAVATREEMLALKHRDECGGNEPHTIRACAL